MEPRTLDNTALLEPEDDVLASIPSASIEALRPKNYLC